MARIGAIEAMPVRRCLVILLGVVEAGGLEEEVFWFILVLEDGHDAWFLTILGISQEGAILVR